MSANLTQISKKLRFPVSSLLLQRIAIYSAVVAGITVPFTDFKLKNLSEPKQYIASINKGQQAYYAGNDQFSNDIAKLGLGLKEQTAKYNYTIVSSMGPVQTLRYQRKPVRYQRVQFESMISMAKPHDMNTGKSYTGAVFAFKKKNSNVITTIAGICESDSMNASDAVIWNPPTFDGITIHCPPGTTMLTKSALLNQGMK